MNEPYFKVYFRVPGHLVHSCIVGKTWPSHIDQLNLKAEGRELEFLDPHGAYIHFEDLPGIISQYRSSSSFFVEFHFDGTTSTNVGNINLIKELECYLRNGDFPEIFSEYSKKKTLSDSSRRCLVRESINFLRQRSGNYPNREEKIALAEAIIVLFPAYKVENSDCGGIDLFFNPATSSGYLVAKLKNFNSKRRKLTTASVKEEQTQESDSGSDEDIITKEDLIFFQNCLVSDQLIIKEKLQQTLKARINYCTAQVNVLEAFPIFVFDSSLILFDFELRFGELKSNELFNNWEKYKHFVDEIGNEAGVHHSIENVCDFPIDVIPFLRLLKLLPSTAAGRDTKRATILKSVDSFITFEQDHTPIEKYNVESEQPTIIAVGENKSSISQYFLSLKGKCINIPVNYNFVQVFDLYFKSFYIFNIEFDITLANFLRYFAKFLYCIDNKKAASPRLVEIHSKFQMKFKALA